jgi:hypothetical protein
MQQSEITAATKPLPVLPAIPPQYGGTMRDPLSGLIIPKTRSANIEWRKTLLEKAKTSRTYRDLLKRASSQSYIFWLNAFGFTFLQKKVGIDGKEIAVTGGASHIPFITWKVQDDALLELQAAIEQGHDALIDKSRDMGASWIVLSLFHWNWQFRPSSTFLELSRKQALVDRRGDMDSLFEKHRYLLRMQPEWLRPRRVRDNLMHLENQDIGTSIEGESTNKDAGQASRKTAIMLDEFARVEEGEEIDLATADTSACRIFNSTTGGPLTHFTRVYRAMKSGVRKGKIITLPWWRHPDKGKGVYATVEDNEPIYTSPWREEEKLRRSKRNLAQNIDMKHGQAGDVFFDGTEIEKHRQLYEAPPLLEGNILFDDEMTPDTLGRIVRKQDHSKMVWSDLGTFKPWRLWVPLIDGRPSQLTQYVIGVDISGGSGAANSVITVLDHSTNMIVGKWWDAHTSPEQLAAITALSATWFGGVRQPLVIFEKNGVGTIFGNKLLSTGYANIWMQRVDGTRDNKRTPRWGWHSSPARKEMLLGEYRDALKNAQIINPCKQSLDEALEYIYDDKGRIEPGSLGFEDGGGTALHGDHVIADALCVLGRKELPKTLTPPPVKTPGGTFASRQKAAKLRQDPDRYAWSR